MSTWTTAVSDLRNLLNDNEKDRYVYRKKVFGTVDGTNTSFKTFEFRRITDFSDSLSSILPLGVYVNGAPIAVSGIDSDSTDTGEFVFKKAPTKGDLIQATYYTRQWLDAELVTFLTNACAWLQLGLDYTKIPNTLWEATLHYAAGNALRKIAMRWSQRASDAFLLEDAPKKEALGVAETYMKLADIYNSTAIKLRDDNYANRSGQAMAPNFASAWGAVSAVTPKR